MSTTTDFAKFGWRERKMAAALLEAACSQGFPEDFEDDEVTIMMNMNSGNVFFTNSEYQVAMMNGDELESFYSCPQCGSEGFKSEIHENENKDDLNSECWDYLVAIGAREEEEESDDDENEEEAE